MQDRFVQALAERRSQDRLRQLRSFEPARAGFISRQGREYLDLSSNDYLGLAHHPQLAQRCAQWAQSLGTGARASRLVCGTLSAHQHLEAKIAAFKGAEAALLFASGWQANASIFPALLALDSGALVFADKLVHASIHHGISAAQKRQIRFRHNDLDHLEQLLEKHAKQAETLLVVTESVFSMDGDICDLARLSAIARKHGAFLIVDEAHATGVLGAGGAGLCAELDPKPDLVMGTFSKAMGSFGAYVAGSAALCEYLVNCASGFVYSTALPPPVLGAIDAALDIVPGLDDQRSHLAALASQLRTGLKARDFDCGASQTQIVPVMAGSEEDALRMAAMLEDKGIMGVAIRPPTVPAGSSRIRLALSSVHTEADVARVLDALGEAA